MRLRLITESFRYKVDGGLRYHGKGDVIDVDDAIAARLVSLGSAVDADKQPEPEPVAEPEESPEPETESPVEDAPERPKNAANKDTWAAYYKAVKGTDPGKLTREEIIAAVG